ncbi:MAG: HDOD domain-containing protein [Phycisphaerales bacterium]|nr:HDOD domain-containing protein [Phycisphaerales bacterium]
MAHPIFERIKEHPDLPSPKGVALEVLRLARRDDTSLHEITKVLQTDPALATRLLKAVNSPALGLGRPVAALRQAASLLGLRAVTQLTLGFSLLSEHRSGRCAGFDFQRFWSASLGRAVTMRRLAQVHGEPCPEEAFTCGLLSQVGQLALTCVFAERYGELLRLHERQPEKSILELERASLGIDHILLTADMMADWRIPGEFCEAVRALAHRRSTRVLEDHATPNLLASQLALAVDVAEILARKAAPRGTLSGVIHQAQATGIEPLDFIELFDGICEDWLAAGTVFSVAAHKTPSLPQMYAEARALREADPSRAAGSRAPAPRGGAEPAVAASPARW